MAKKALLCLAVASVTFFVLASAFAQNLAPGTVSNVQLYNNGAGPGVCPTDFWSPGGNATAPVCYSATMSCSAHSSTVPTLNFIYSYVNPASVIGTVVIFSGGSGTLGTLGEHSILAAGFYGANYEVVEVAWQTDWEQTSDPLGIMTASCRPAGFLKLCPADSAS